MKIKIVLLIGLAFLIAGFYPRWFFTSNDIYRSIQPGITSAIATNASGTITITISGTTLTASAAMPDTFGQGDMVHYDVNNNGTPDNTGFVVSRESATQFTLQDSLGGSGTLNAVTNDDSWNAYRAYTSLVNARNKTENTGIPAANRNFDQSVNSLITTLQTRNLVCYPGTDASAVDFNDWDSDTSNRLRIYTPYLSTQAGRNMRHSGKFTARCYFLSTSDATGSIKLTTASGNDHWFEITGLQIKNTIGDGFHNGDAGTSTDVMYFDSCIFIGSDNSSTSASHSGIDISGGAGTWRISNCLFYQWNSTAASNNNAGVHVNQSSSTAYIYNCTSWDGDRAFTVVSGTGVAKNSIATSGTSGSPTNWQGSWGAASTNNVDNRSAAPGSNAKNGQVPAYVDSTNFNFHLKSTDTVALGAGVDLSADANYPFTNDIDSATRSGTWDRGIDQQNASYSFSNPSAPEIIPVKGLQRLRRMW